MIRRIGSCISLHHGSRCCAIVAALQRHEDLARLVDVRRALHDAGVPVAVETRAEPSFSIVPAMLAATNGDTSPADSELMLIWQQCVAVYVPRCAHDPNDIIVVLDSLSSMLHHTPHTQLPIQWMHLIVVRIMRLALLAAAGDDLLKANRVDRDPTWIAVIKRQQELWAVASHCPGGPVDASVRTLVMLHQYSFFKAPGHTVNTTEVGQLLSHGTRSATFPRLVIDARVIGCWNLIQPWAEVGLREFARSGVSVWASQSKDVLANASMQELKSMNDQLSAIGRGSSASTVV